MSSSQNAKEFEPRVLDQLTGGWMGWKNWAWLAAIIFILVFNYLNPTGGNPWFPKARTDGILTQAQADWLDLFEGLVLTPLVLFLFGMIFMASMISRRWRLIRRTD